MEALKLTGFVGERFSHVTTATGLFSSRELLFFTSLRERPGLDVVANLDWGKVDEGEIGLPCRNNDIVLSRRMGNS